MWKSNFLGIFFLFISFLVTIGIPENGNAQSCSAILNRCIESGMTAPGCIQDIRACQTRHSPLRHNPKRCLGGLAKCLGVDQIQMIDGPRAANVHFINGSVRSVTLKIEPDPDSCLTGGEYGHEDTIEPNRITDYLTSIHVKTNAKCAGRTAHFSIIAVMDDFPREPQNFTLGTDGELALVGKVPNYTSTLEQGNNGNYRWSVILPDLVNDTACPANSNSHICQLGKAIEAQARELCPSGDRKEMLGNCLLTRGQCLETIPGYAEGKYPPIYDREVDACNVHAEACMIGCDIVAQKRLRQDVADYMLKTCSKDRALSMANICSDAYRSCQKALPDAEKYKNGFQKMQAAGAAIFGSYDCMGELYQCSHACDKN